MRFSQTAQEMILNFDKSGSFFASNIRKILFQNTLKVPIQFAATVHEVESFFVPISLKIAPDQLNRDGLEAHNTHRWVKLK